MCKASSEKAMVLMQSNRNNVKRKDEKRCVIELDLTILFLSFPFCSISFKAISNELVVAKSIFFCRGDVKN